VPSRLTGGYHLAFGIGAGLLALALAFVVGLVVLRPQGGREPEPAHAQPAYSEA